MPLLQYGQVGPVSPGAGDASQVPLRLDRTGAVVVQELHGRFYEQTNRGNVFATTANAIVNISNVTFTIATLGATGTPIIGVWNPVGSGVNLVVLQAYLTVIMTALQNTGCGGFFWAYSGGNIGLTLGTAPTSRKTLTAFGSQAKGFVTGVAMTGQTTTLVVTDASSLNGGSGYNIALLGTAAGFQPYSSTTVENFDGSMAIPPGGMLALLAGTTPVAHSAIGGILWEEVPLLS